MKYLLLAGLLTGCNFGLVDIKTDQKTCYNRVFDMDTGKIDSTAFDCSTHDYTTPFDHFMDPIIK